MIDKLWEWELITQLRPTLSDPMNCNTPGSSVYGILQARVLEWVAILFSRETSDPGIEPTSPALQMNSLLSEPPGKTNGLGTSNNLDYNSAT